VVRPVERRFHPFYVRFRPSQISSVGLGAYTRNTMKSVSQKYHEEIQPEGTGEEFKRDTNLSRADSRLEGRFPSMKKRILLRTPTGPYSFVLRINETRPMFFRFVIPKLRKQCPVRKGKRSSSIHVRVTFQFQSRRLLYNSDATCRTAKSHELSLDLPSSSMSAFSSNDDVCHQKRRCP
jgi:hypothetical protein